MSIDQLGILHPSIKGWLFASRHISRMGHFRLALRDGLQTVSIRNKDTVEE